MHNPAQAKSAQMKGPVITGSVRLVSAGQEDQTDSDRLNLIDRCLTDRKKGGQTVKRSGSRVGPESHVFSGLRGGSQGFEHKETEDFRMK